MEYRIEYQDMGTMDGCWHGRPESYPSPEEANRAIGAVIALGGPWVRRVYRVAPVPKTAPTHPELVRLVQRLRAQGVATVFWYSDDDAEAVLFGDRIAVSLPGGTLWEGLNDRSTGEIVQELQARAARDRAAQERAAAEERERAAAQARERAAQESARIAERERSAAEERARAAERERATARERERIAERARAAAQERERAAAQERERAQRIDALERKLEAALVEAARSVTVKPPPASPIARSAARVAQPPQVASRPAQPPPALPPACVRQAPQAARAAPRPAQPLPTARVAPSSSIARVAQPPPVARAVQVPEGARVAQRPVADVARSRQVARVAQPPQGGGEREIAAFAKLLRCGAWREGMRASDLLASEKLPPGVHRALQELVGTKTPTAREIGNALKRVQDKRIDGIALALTRRIDGHGFAIWQVVDAVGETDRTSARPSDADLLRGLLTGMGFRPAEADYAISALGARVDADTVPLADLVREALSVLAQRSAAAPKARRR